MREQVIWTDLTPREIGEALMEKDLYVSERVIRQLLEDAGYRRSRSTSIWAHTKTATPSSRTSPG